MKSHSAKTLLVLVLTTVGLIAGTGAAHASGNGYYGGLQFSALGGNQGLFGGGGSFFPFDPA